VSAPPDLPPDLLIDLGHSRIKWALARDGVLVPDSAKASPAESLEAMECDLQDNPVRKVWLSGQGHAEVVTAIIELIERLGLSFHQLETGSIELPVKPAYPALGCDRWLALQWAWQQTRAACCIVDCGTAVTVDAIDDRGRHLGGWIMAGLASLRRALGESARNLPAASPEPGPLNRPARDSSTAIGAGTLLQLVGGLEHAIDSVKSGSDARFESNPAVWLTGGDAALILPHMKPPVQLEPQLVLRGLAMASGKS